MEKNATSLRELGSHTVSPPPTLTLERPGQRAIAYVRLLKPRETALLTLIGLCTAVVASDGSPPPGRFLLAAMAILLGSGGTNGLTNYLDRHVDARMRRTRHRVLPQRLIHPPEKALAWAGFLVVVALGLALYLHPYAFMAGAVGVATALIARKTWATHYLGAFSSCGPVLVGWLAISPRVDGTLLLLTLIILLWVPLHVWNLMIAYRSDYLRAGVDIFPLTRGIALTARISFALSILLYVASLALYMAGGFGLIYLVAANVGGILMLRASLHMLRARGESPAFATFKLSAYPFLGLIFLSLCTDTWLRIVV